MFDLGTYDGEGLAYIHAFDRAVLCVCNDIGKCPEDKLRESMSNAASSADVRKHESDGVVAVTNMLAPHPCLDASVGVELYKRGFECAWLNGLHSERARQTVADAYLKVFRPTPTDEASVVERADACFRGL
jgi:hypothetical protein